MNEMNPVWAGILGALIGGAIAAVLTYFITVGRKGKPHFDELLRANLDAVREKTRAEAQERVLDQIRPEIQYFLATEKQFFVKRTRLVIRERLVYRHLPLMGWIEHSHLVEENMDTPALEEFARAAALLMEACAKGGPIAPRRVS